MVDVFTKHWIGIFGATGKILLGNDNLITICFVN